MKRLSILAMLTLSACGDLTSSCLKANTAVSLADIALIGAKDVVARNPQSIAAQQALSVAATSLVLAQVNQAQACAPPIN